VCVNSAYVFVVLVLEELGHDPGHILQTGLADGSSDILGSDVGDRMRHVETELQGQDAWKNEAL